MHADGDIVRTSSTTPGREEKITISRPDIGVIWTIYPAQNSYSEVRVGANSNYRNASLHDSMEWKMDGEEEIDGRLYARFVGERCGGPPAGKARTEYYVDVHTGVRRRIVTYDKRGERALTIDSFYALERPAKELFELPPGLTKL